MSGGGGAAPPSLPDPVSDSRNPRRRGRHRGFADSNGTPLYGALDVPGLDPREPLVADPGAEHHLHPPLPGRRQLPRVRVRLARGQELPAALFKPLTWDQGKEMSQHAQFTIDTGVQVYFCDPRSPWQRGSNENTNGLLRQYFPKGRSLAGCTQAHLDAVADQLNGRPRQTLGWKTPSQALEQALR